MSLTDLNYHLIFSTKERRPQIGADLMPQLSEYIGGIIRNLGGSMAAANGRGDHMHIAATLNQKHAIMDVLKEIKQSSSAWVHQTAGLRDFVWQEGYSAFSVSHSVMPQVISYVQRQVEHHHRLSFQEELIEFLKRHEVKYDERYVFA